MGAYTPVRNACPAPVRAHVGVRTRRGGLWGRADEAGRMGPRTRLARMWIREALTSLPRAGWASVVSGWLRVLFTATAVVGLGRLLDAMLTGSPLRAATAWVVVSVVLAAGCAATSEALPESLRASEERTWRRRVLAPALAAPLPERRAAAGAGEAAGGSKPAGARPGGHPAGGHPGGHPGGSDSDDLRAAVLDAATTGVEKTAAYRATFLAPTLASWTSPLLVLAVGALFVDVVWAAVLLVFVALVPAVILGFGRRLRRSNADYRRLEAAETRRYLEMLEGLGTLVAFGAQNRYLAALAGSVRRTMTELGGLLARNQRMIVVNDSVFSLGMTTAAVAVALWRLSHGAISPGDTLAAVLLSVLLLEPIDRVGRSFYVGLAGRARRDGIERLVARIEPAGGPHQPLRVAGVPELRLVGIGVELGGRTVLQDVHLTLPAGSRTALVGPSGAGKSTLARVLQGLQEPTTGQVLADEASTTAAQRRGLASLVSQAPGLVQGSVRENLLLAAPGASDEELHDALRRAHLLDEVLAMPQGLNTPVGDAGSKLSGGQRRRLAIARALLCDAPLLLLDEPTADLDRRTEQLVAASLAEAARGRTCVLVAHRLATLAGVDQVLVLEHGRVTAVGAPHEVLDRSPWFAGAHTAEVGR